MTCGGGVAWVVVARHGWWWRGVGGGAMELRGMGDGGVAWHGVGGGVAWRGVGGGGVAPWRDARPPRRPHRRAPPRRPLRDARPPRRCGILPEQRWFRSTMHLLVRVFLLILYGA